MAGSVIEECDHILNLVNTLLEITAADSGLLQPKLEPQDAAQIIREGCELFEPVAAEKELTLDLAAPPNLPWIGDRQILQRVLSNLLDNAIKYSGEGASVRVSLTSLPDRVQLEVQDSGPGIDPSEHELIFQRFYRCRSAGSQKGNGLGLSFCKSVVEAMGGQLSIRSQPGSGSVFCLVLPNKR